MDFIGRSFRTLSTFPNWSVVIIHWVFFTILSGIEYFYKGRDVFKHSK